jgi:hypothetical protein
MTAKDRWTQGLKCPECGKEGTAELWQYDGWSFKDDQATRVSHVPDGFSYVEKEGTPIFFCIEHPARLY